jgi:hypothetical protein
LTKWYLDCVDDAGNVCIVYWARLGWITYASVLESRDGRIVQRSHMTRSPRPRIDGNDLYWQGLGLTVTMRRSAGRFKKTLHEGLQWTCEMPRAGVVIQDGASEMRGVGYAEVLEMRVAPWKLPIDELRWGRFGGDHSSVVWIDWRGSNPLTLILNDGVLDRDAVVRDRVITFGGATLDLSDDRSLRDATLGKTLSFLHFLPKRIAGAREQKWCSRGELKRADATVDSGWSIHELVTFA